MHPDLVAKIKLLQDERINKIHHLTTDVTRSVPKVNSKLVLTEKEILEKYQSKPADEFDSTQKSIKKALDVLMKNWKPLAKGIKNPQSPMELRLWKAGALHHLTTVLGKKEEVARNMVNEYVLRWQAAREARMKDAYVNQFHTVEALKYIPPPDGKNQLRGRFLAKVQPYGDEIFVERSWVIENFEEDVVHSVVQAGIDNIDKNFEFLPTPHRQVLLEKNPSHQSQGGMQHSHSRAYHT
jgi:hypothetical protein